MREWFDNQKKSSSDWRKKLNALIEEKAPKRRQVTKE